MKAFRQPAEHALPAGRVVFAGGVRVSEAFMADHDARTTCGGLEAPGDGRHAPARIPVNSDVAPGLHEEARRIQLQELALRREWLAVAGEVVGATSATRRERPRSSVSCGRCPPSPTIAESPRTSPRETRPRGAGRFQSWRATCPASHRRPPWPRSRARSWLLSGRCCGACGLRLALPLGLEVSRELSEYVGPASRAGAIASEVGH